MGTNAVLDRLQQTEPKVLIACDGVTYGGCDFDRMAVVQELRAGCHSTTGCGSFTPAAPPACWAPTRN
jgi:acetoacetyl-CoA synthetase